jgi:hypothetical protein
MVVCVIVMVVVMMVVVIVTMVVIVAGAVGPAFGLKGLLNSQECCSETAQHFFNHVVGTDAQSAFANLGRKMAISKVPGEPHQLMAVFVADFHQRLARCGDPKPSSVVELKAVAVGHGDCLWQIKQNVLTLVCGKADAPSMTGVEIERESAGGHFFRPVSRGAMNRSVAHGDSSSIKEIALG